MLFCLTLWATGTKTVDNLNQTQHPTSVEVVPVKTAKQRRIFIDVPWNIYADDPMWVPPLRLERRLHFSSMNPYFKNAEWQAWIAISNGRPVGRISAQIDQMHQQVYGPTSGHFGLLEGVNNASVFTALLNSAEAWLVERGIRQVSGPFSFSINQECGVLVDGFDTPPVILMPHSRQWYAAMLEQHGYRPAMDLLAYWINTDFQPSRVMSTIVRRFTSKVKLRHLRRDRFSDELEILRDIFNDAWSDNWGYIPFTREEFADLGNSLRYIVPDEFIQIAEIDGRPVSFIVLLPNLNEVLAKLNGRLFPTGWLKLIKAVRNRTIHTGRVPLMGVRKEYQNSPLGMALSFMVCDSATKEAIKWGIKGVEMSWILENNKGMRNILNNIGSPEYKRYRIYEKNLGQA